MITKNQREIRNKVRDYVEKYLSNLYMLTGGMGIEFGKEKRYFENAKKASFEKKIVKEGRIYWVPLIIENKTIAVCGIKSKKEELKEEIKLLEGLMSEIQYNIFLKKQAEKFTDPKSNFIRKLLETDEIVSFDQAIDKGDILGINLRFPQAVILVKTPGLFKKLHDKYKNNKNKDASTEINKESQEIINTIKKAFKNYDQNTVACMGPDLFIVLKWVKGDVNTLNTIKFFKDKSKYIEEILENKFNIDVAIGTGQYYPGLEGLKKSYSDALTALELGERIWGTGGVYHISDIGMFVSLSKDINFERKCELAHQLMGDVFKDKSLHKTIKVFLENNMNLTDSAKKLHLHRNTLIYRLDKIKKDVGLDPRRFQDAVQLKLGLMLYSPFSSKCKKEIK